MPRFGKQFKVYNRILPSLILDVTDIIEDCKLKINKNWGFKIWENAGAYRRCYGKNLLNLSSPNIF